MTERSLKLSKTIRHLEGREIASFLQSARCPVVSQPKSRLPYSKVVGGVDEKQNIVKTIKMIE